MPPLPALAHEAALWNGSCNQAAPLSFGCTLYGGGDCRGLVWACGGWTKGAEGLQAPTKEGVEPVGQ